MGKRIKINLLRSAVLLGIDYLKGIHEVDTDVKKEPMYSLLLKDKMVQEVVDGAVVVNEVVAKLEERITAAIKKYAELEELFTASGTENAELIKENAALKKEITKLKK